MNLQQVFFVVCSIILAVVFHISAAPAETSSLRSGSDLPIGQPFDEIVVESTLNVKRKTDGNRQSRNQQSASIRTKRQNGFPNFPRFPSFGGSTAEAQAQSTDVTNSLGHFGASASGSQSQSLAFGPNGPVSSASFTGAQQYRLPNGQFFSVSFGNAAGNTGSNKANGATLALSGPKR